MYIQTDKQELASWRSTKGRQSVQTFGYKLRLMKPQLVYATAWQTQIYSAAQCKHMHHGIHIQHTTLYHVTNARGRARAHTHTTESTSWFSKMLNNRQIKLRDSCQPSQNQKTVTLKPRVHP